VHFDYSSLFTDAKVKKSLESEKNVKSMKEPSDENQTQCHEIEPNPSKDRAMHEGDNPSFFR
jgi:hypothetical protein